MNQKFIDDSPVFNRNNSFCTYLKGRLFILFLYFDFADCFILDFFFDRC